MSRSEKTVLCIGISVLDIIARPVGAPDSWKEKQRIESISLLPGGDAANQSIHLASLGCHALFNGCVGDDANGKTVRLALEGRGVDTSLLRVRDGVRTGTALLLVSSDGERHIFSVAGAHSTLSRRDLPDEIPEGCAAISLGSLFGMPVLEEEGLLEFLQKVRAQEIPVFADMDSGRVTALPERIRRLLPYIDYFLPSAYDIMPLMGKDTIVEAAHSLLKAGVRHVIVKCGAEGALVFEGTDIAGSADTGRAEGNGVRIGAVPVQPLDTSGAGDCMSAAFIYRILEGDQIEEACRYACAAGSLSTLYPGANTIELQDIKVREMMGEAEKIL